ncbi:Arm DNA-binding domain-containing protein [Duganella margarita]|uniref:Arm DNA-binding domain-containing protein n=1 Tax=Duganella margarita TaxID=2692170 RepID=UPI002277272F|nr:Arm DNA-binding domain-containing protein [Duganella margarita]
MAKLIVSLTEMQVRNAKRREKAYRLFDGGGLYLEVAPGGSRIWRMKFRQISGKENVLTFRPISRNNARGSARKAPGGAKTDAPRS